MTALQFIIIMKYCGSGQPSSIDPYRWSGMLRWYESRFKYNDWIEDDIIC